MTLLPCPFCGGDAAFGKGVNYSFVNCVECMGSTDTIMASGCQWTEKEAAEKWNTRAAQQDGAWQPIETAPKGRDIWACDPERGYAARVRIVIGNEAECIDYDGRRMGVGFYPKYWRELPAMGIVTHEQ